MEALHYSRLKYHERVEFVDDTILMALGVVYAIFLSAMFGSNMMFKDDRLAGNPDRFSTWAY